MNLSDFDYNLPEELIAQRPCEKRQNSKMMVLDKTKHLISHKHFFDIVDFLNEDDLLVLNNTKVIPARVFATKKDTGAKIEIFILKILESKNYFECLIRPSKRVKESSILILENGVSVNVVKKIDEDGKWLIYVDYEHNFLDILPQVGNIPLPPYIERSMDKNDFKNLDYERYQTVYAKKEGSVAAPTAGLHFTPEILEAIKNKGIKIAYVNLNVGLGTFKPVKCENILEHKMDSESFEIDEENANIINEALAQNKNIIAVGTTTVRTLETTMAKYNKILPIKDASTLFIYPGYEFKVVNKLITNFHLPKSTLIMLTSAFAGKDFVFEAYQQAIEQQYRFYSYGDCMFLY